MGFVTLNFAQFGPGYYFLKNLEDNRIIYIHSDDELCLTAYYFGWKPCYQCNETDGTVDCKHRKSVDMIKEVQEWMHNHLGDKINDPGWFL